jgi:hypothetical protein
MIVRLSTVREESQAIPLLSKEGLGVVGRDASAGAHHPYPPPVEEGNHLRAEKET